MSAPRNHVVLALVKRSGGAGRHGKSKKALRVASKMALRKEINY